MVLGKLFLGALFTKVICTFLKSVWKDGFFDTPCDLTKQKNFHLLIGSVCTFYELKSPKWKQPLSISENGFLWTRLRISSPFLIFMPDIWASKSLVPTEQYLQYRYLSTIYRRKIRLVESNVKCCYRKNRILAGLCLLVGMYTVKKRLAVFPSPAGMSLTKFSQCTVYLS